VPAPDWRRPARFSSLPSALGLRPSFPHASENVCPPKPQRFPTMPFLSPHLARRPRQTIIPNHTPEFRRRPDCAVGCALRECTDTAVTTRLHRRRPAPKAKCPDSSTLVDENREASWPDHPECDLDRANASRFAVPFGYGVRCQLRLMYETSRRAPPPRCRIASSIARRRTPKPSSLGARGCGTQSSGSEP